jgi:hypothetical protein
MKMLRYSAILLGALMFAPLVAKASPVDLFSGSGDGNTFSFSLPASPTGTVQHGINNFYISSVPVDFNGTISNVKIEFYDYGGFDFLNVGTGHLFDHISLFGPQLFTGSLSAPAFNLGTFSLKNYQASSPYNLTISAATSEPSTLLLFGTGIAALAMIGAVRHKSSRV